MSAGRDARAGYSECDGIPACFRVLVRPGPNNAI